MGHPKWWREGGRRRVNGVIFCSGETRGEEGGWRYLGKGSTTTNRYFCVSKLPQSPTETKPEEENAQTDKVEYFRGWSCSSSGGGGGGGGGERQGGENR